MKKQIEKAIYNYENDSEDVHILNKYLKIKLERNGETQIYVNNKPFRMCTYLLLHIDPNDKEQYQVQKEIQSIDEAESKLSQKHHGYGKSKIRKKFGITPQEEFKAHASNLQAWVENDYNTQILHRTLAFPLLKELMKYEDPKAKKVYKDELAYRISSNDIVVTKFLIDRGYLKDLEDDEVRNIIDDTKPGIAKLMLIQFYQRRSNSGNYFSMRLDFNEKKMSLSIEKGQVLITSIERNKFTYDNYKRSIRLKDIEEYSRYMYNNKFLYFGINEGNQKILYKKRYIDLANQFFTNKAKIYLQIPRTRAPLKLFVKDENLAIFINSELLY